MYSGGCHCGRVAFQVEGKIDRVLRCNCSVCAKKGFLHWIVERERFRLLTSEEELSSYRFGSHTAKHHFCRTCGIHSFYVPKSHPNGFSVNVRCLDDVDFTQIDIVDFDGRNWEEARANLDSGLEKR